jgi:hypothetical protein
MDASRESVWWGAGNINRVNHEKEVLMGKL